MGRREGGREGISHHASPLPSPSVSSWSEFAIPTQLSPPRRHHALSTAPSHTPSPSPSTCDLAQPRPLTGSPGGVFRQLSHWTPSTTPSTTPSPSASTAPGDSAALHGFNGTSHASPTPLPLLSCCVGFESDGQLSHTCSTYHASDVRHSQKLRKGSRDATSTHAHRLRRRCRSPSGCHWEPTDSCRTPARRRDARG